ncbi:potassium channel protein [Spirochaetia bacterium 38H-sp]|uniref:Potassium channel protein n=1 Tax=Rarispira pelagica TaxID=3141764 RepID=A0ABU9UB97_9SPIR
MNITLRILLAVSLIAILLGVGTLGYSTIEGWNIIDSLYMAIITLTTVGFSEVAPLSNTGKLFTIIYIIMGIGSAGFAITTLFGYIFEGPMMQTLKERKMKLLKKRLNNHHIVCGYGAIGKEVVEEFNRAGIYHVLIDKNMPEEIINNPGYSIPIAGDANDEEVLKDAHIENANSLIATLNDDVGNLFLVMTARQLNPNIKIITEATEEMSVKKLRRVGADIVITPYKIVGKRIVQSLLKPSLTHFLDIVSDKDPDKTLKIEEFKIPAKSKLIGKSLKETDIGRQTGAIILAIADQHGKVRSNSNERENIAGIALQQGDSLIAIGNDEQLKKLETFLNT